MFFNESSNRIISVSELNDRVSQCLQQNFPPLWVSGEIRGLTRAASGHWYFTLKDKVAELSCAMFAGDNRRVAFVPKTGDKVEVYGQVSIYKARGTYQLVVSSMRQAGMGELFERFLMVKNKLQAEGLFDQARKKAIPRVNFQIAVVTSLKAAALRDTMTTLARRAPYAKVTIFPTAVQGDEAPAEIIRSLKTADESALADVILLVRGGGSLQDLWAFNEEAVARTIASLKTPVIVGVGHESDVTIADWVADFRAATPTAAAEHATERLSILLSEIQTERKLLADAWLRRYNEEAQRLDWARAGLQHPQDRLQRELERYRYLKTLLDSSFAGQFRQASEKAQLAKAELHQRWLLSLKDRQMKLTELGSALTSPKALLGIQTQRLHNWQMQLQSLFQSQITEQTGQWRSLATLLEEVSPHAIMKKGYTYVTDSSGHLLREARQIKAGQDINIRWPDGEAFGKISDVRYFEKDLLKK